MGAKTTSTDNEHLKGGEQRLVNALRAGEACKFVYEGKNKEPDDARTLRGDVLGQLLRGELVEGETEPIKLGRAVSIEGAIITGPLDMSDTDAELVLRITHSDFKAPIDFTRAKLALLDLGHSQTVDVSMEFLRTESHLWLDHIKCEGKFNIASAKIGGQFAANDATFNNLDGKAISAQAAEIAGGVFLLRATVTGEAAFKSAKIGGQFAAAGASFNAAGQIALNLFHANISGNVWLSDMPHPPIGHIEFTNAVMTHIVIDKNSLPLGILYLDGTRYTNLTDKTFAPQRECDGWFKPKEDNFGKPLGYWDCYAPLRDSLISQYPDAPLDLLSKESWRLLDATTAKQKSHTRTPFAYRQFAKVLDSNGHESEAREVRLKAGDAYTKRTAKNINSPIMRGVFKLWRKVLKMTTGYGERLQYAAYWLIALWLFGAVFFYLFEASIVPSRERFYLSEAYTAYLKNGTLPNGYPAFDPLIYALDVMLPIVDFSQETHWRPTNTDGKTNWVRLFNRVYLGLGWFLSTIGIAGLTGLLKDKREP